MNEFQELYLVKEEIEKKISVNKLFKLSITDASQIILKNVAVFNRIILSAELEKIQNYLKKIAKTNITVVDEVDFFQESLKWIFRWCSRYCSVVSTINKNEVVADDIFELMGVAFAYDKFHKMWDLHSTKKTIYTKINNKITFDFRNEEVYKTHVFYDSYYREYKKEKQKEELFSLISNNRDLIQNMHYAHQMGFSSSLSMEFEGFNLEEYKLFTSTLTKIFTEHMLTSLRENIIVPGKDGLLYLIKEEWIDLLSKQSDLSKKTVENIINFLTYDFSNESSDISLSYFLPLLDNQLLVSEVIFNLSNPEVNIMRLLAKRESSNFDRAQNNFEAEERKYIKNSILGKYLVSNVLDKSKKNRPGMDLIVYDKEFNHLQIIELKYKVPIESVRDITNLDNNLEKAYEQVKEAKNYVEENISIILGEYFGEEYKNIIPEKVDYFVLTNFSVGTGINCSLPTQILLADHYIEIMKKQNGMELIRCVLNDKKKMLPIKESKRYSRFSLLGYKILIPEHSFRLI